MLTASCSPCLPSKYVKSLTCPVGQTRRAARRAALCLHFPDTTKVASSEGAVGAIADLHERGLIAPEAKFVPAAAGTMLTPTSPLERSNLEKLLHRYLNEDDPEVSFIRAQLPVLLLPLVHLLVS